MCTYVAVIAKRDGKTWTAARAMGHGKNRNSQNKKQKISEIAKIRNRKSTYMAHLPT